MRVGVRVRVGDGVGVIVGRGVQVSEGVHVGGGGLVGVRVQLGMGVRVAVCVADSAAMNVLLRAVSVAEVASMSGSMVAVREGVTEAVSEGGKVPLGVLEADCVAVWLGDGIPVGEEASASVDNTAGSAVGENS